MAASGPGEGAGSQTLAVGQPLSSGPRGAGAWGRGWASARSQGPPRPGWRRCLPRTPGPVVPAPSPPTRRELSAEPAGEAGSPLAALGGKAGSREGTGQLSSCGGKRGVQAKGERSFWTIWESREKVVKSEFLRTHQKKKKKGKAYKRANRLRGRR